MKGLGYSYSKVGRGSWRYHDPTIDEQSKHDVTMLRCHRRCLFLPFSASLSSPEISRGESCASIENRDFTGMWHSRKPEFRVTLARAPPRAWQETKKGREVPVLIVAFAVLATKQIQQKQFIRSGINPSTHAFCACAGVKSREKQQMLGTINRNEAYTQQELMRLLGFKDRDNRAAKRAIREFGLKWIEFGGRQWILGEVIIDEMKRRGTWDDNEK